MPRPVFNPPNPWQSVHVEWLGPPPDAALEVYEEEARSILAENESPDVGFRWSVNPYRGCFHGCVYCYARPTHQYLDWGAGTDFERKLVVKVNAPELLRRALRRRPLQGEVLAFSGVTDCYQPLEAGYGLTRRCLEVCLETRTPVCIVTKGVLVERDAALLGELQRVAGATVYLSIPFRDTRVARVLEPYAPPPARRFAALERLRAAGVETGLALAPLVPGLNESDVPGLLRAARRAGATRAFLVLLRLPPAVEPVFRRRLAEGLPLRARRVLNGLREMRRGLLHTTAFHARMRGTGPRYEAVAALFRTWCRRLGLKTPP